MMAVLLNNYIYKSVAISAAKAQRNYLRKHVGTKVVKAKGRLPSVKLLPLEHGTIKCLKEEDCNLVLHSQ